ncbi:HelD family protein [Enterococcus sp. LJL128]
MTISTEEQKHLTKTLETLEKAFQISLGKEQKTDAGYMELKKYTVDYHHELDKYEVYDYQKSLASMDRQVGAERQSQQKLRYALSSPYFARIDFCYDDESEAERFYIGRFGFSQAAGDSLIYDWRAPVASLYYDFGPGTAEYQTDSGCFSGELTKKRQIKVEDGLLQYVVDTDQALHDEVLMEELTNSSSEQMKTIIHTIQKEQNQIIRDQQTKHLIIQGVAGSGKTSIALHRIAYLLYNKRTSLRASEVLILSPNAVFSDFIAGVLPELGEEELIQQELGTILQPFLPQLTIDSSYLKETNNLSAFPNSQQAKRCREINRKGFTKKLKNYLEEVAKAPFEKGIEAGTLQLSKEALNNLFALCSSSASVYDRVDELAKQLFLRQREEQQTAKSLTQKQIHQLLLKRLIHQSPLSIYKDFCSKTGLMFTSKNKEALSYSDIFPLLLCKFSWEGQEEIKNVKHLIIDEMQDYSEIQYEVISRLFSCSKTILGDVSQNISLEQGLNSQEISKYFSDGRMVELNKSYRSSYEIIQYARRFLSDQKLIPVERHGKLPEVKRYKNLTDQMKQLEELFIRFSASGSQLCGVICKNSKEIAEIKNFFKERELHVLDENSKQFKRGINLTTFTLAKGLEFDVVILPYITEENYHSNLDKNLLYVGCTRAMSELYLLESDQQPSQLLKQS